MGKPVGTILELTSLITNLTNLTSSEHKMPGLTPFPWHYSSLDPLEPQQPVARRRSHPRFADSPKSSSEARELGHKRGIQDLETLRCSAQTLRSQLDWSLKTGIGSTPDPSRGFGSDPSRGLGPRVTSGCDANSLSVRPSLRRFRVDLVVSSP